MLGPPARMKILKTGTSKRGGIAWKEVMCPLECFKCGTLLVSGPQFSGIFLLICDLLLQFSARRPSQRTSCYTISGMDSDSDCRFPFMYNGVTYTGCTTVHGDAKPWCVTKADAYGNALDAYGDPVSIGGNLVWGHCHASCPKGLESFILFLLISVKKIKNQI